LFVREIGKIEKKTIVFHYEKFILNPIKYTHKKQPFHVRVAIKTLPSLTMFPLLRPCFLKANVCFTIVWLLIFEKGRYGEGALRGLRGFFNELIIL